MQSLHFLSSKSESCNATTSDMADMTETRARLERLKKMRDTGVTSTSNDGVTTTFRSLADLNQTIIALERELGDRAPRARTRSVFMGHR